MVHPKPPDEPTAALATADDLNELWALFRSGASVPCPTDGGPMALTVDGSVGVYRFVCTSCGLASAWFDSAPDGVHVRTATPGPSTRTTVDDRR